MFTEVENEHFIRNKIIVESTTADWLPKMLNSGQIEAKIDITESWTLKSAEYVKISFKAVI